MADDTKTTRKAPAKSKDAEDSVLGSLPATRPSRLSRRGRAEGEGPVATAAKPAPTRAKPKARPAAAKATAKPKPAAKPAPKPARKPQLKAVPAAGDAKSPKPLAVRAATPNLRESAATANENREPAEERADAKSQSGKDLATTVVQAAGELAQIGLAVGGQIIKRAVDKLPKP
jgi:hypothetical protein